ncbi:UDP-N-acetyl-D-mannosaminuronic acid dehydrogenase [Paraoerskovia marina]|uniref:UDP-N-acetyl-D-mannosaminuronic acid dehydrogenase n=1 Tax=Paraoerskovia marina TaxID=545619 RepID=A0A1H1Q6Q2_9CELL|nr:UDP-N-acetyl-D-mannosamine dehydrogenase [Paraoerskovia marina]SDS19105.1 UDP-N-acetyl-D-mannosaminuronic acid dehydrogenase [Paraoerskovia marina]
MSISTVAVIGLGYIGLPTAAILASNDVKVIGVDVNTATVDAVNRGDVPFVEPDLATYVAGAVTHGTLRATTTPEPADAFIVAVPTPFTDDMKPDLTYIEAAAKSIAPCLRGGNLVILESTSPPKATERMAAWILEERPDLSLDGTDNRPIIHFAHCPERVLPGRIMVELVTNDRVVGGLTVEAAEVARNLYRVFCQGEILLTDATTAEMTKLAENTFRDVNIAFANELASICEKVDVDVWELIRLANHHPRVEILRPGPGVGGHCIAVDPWFIVDAAPKRARLIRRARKLNDRKPRQVAKTIAHASMQANAQKIALLGLAFKPDIDDLRESPAVQVLENLRTLSPLPILVIEPHIDRLPNSLAKLSNVQLVTIDGLEHADVVARLVAHHEFDDLPHALSHASISLDFAGPRNWQRS